MSDEMSITQQQFSDVVNERVRLRVLLDKKLNPAVIEHNKEYPPISADSLIMAMLMYCTDWIDQFADGSDERKAVMFSQYADAFAKMAGFEVVHEQEEDIVLTDIH